MARPPKAAPTATVSTGPVPPAHPVQVRATSAGIYAHVRRRPGDVFTIATDRELGSWMQRVSDAPVVADTALVADPVGEPSANDNVI